MLLCVDDDRFDYWGPGLRQKTARSFDVPAAAVAGGVFVAGGGVAVGRPCDQNHNSSKKNLEGALEEEEDQSCTKAVPKASASSSDWQAPGLPMPPCPRVLEYQ